MQWGFNHTLRCNEMMHATTKREERMPKISREDQKHREKQKDQPLTKWEDDGFKTEELRIPITTQEGCVMTQNDKLLKGHSRLSCHDEKKFSS